MISLHFPQCIKEPNWTPFSFFSNVTFQKFSINFFCFVLLSGGTVEAHLHMDTGLQGSLSFSHSKDWWGPSANPSDRSRKADAHSDSHHWALFYNNLPVWVMLTIIRPTECQTIVRKAVKHFVLLSPTQACDLSSQKKCIKKKISVNSDILFKLQPPAFPTACRLTSLGLNARLSNFFPSFIEQVAGVGSRHCRGELVCQEQEQNTS